jgi:hypothetical protein
MHHSTRMLAMSKRNCITNASFSAIRICNHAMNVQRPNVKR